MEKLKEIIDLSFPRFFRYFAIYSLTSEDGKVFVAETKGEVAGFAKLITFNVGAGSTDVSCGLRSIPHIDGRESP